MHAHLRTGVAVLGLALCVMASAVTSSHAAWVVYNVTLNGANEAPPNASPGTGTATVAIDAVAHKLYIHLDFAGTLGTTTACHIHAATAVAGTGTAGVATTTPFFAGFPIGVTSGTYDITLDETLASSWNPAYVTANGGTTATAEAAMFAFFDQQLKGQGSTGTKLKMRKDLAYAENGDPRQKVDVYSPEGANNLHWVWHVNWLDEPEQKWNAFENYFPGEKYCDWVALSAYGPTTPRMEDGTENFAFKMREAYPRLLKIAPGKPIVIAEFGCDLHNKHCDAAEWARDALADIFSGKWSAIMGFCWWNEGWQNDDHKKNDTDMIIWHDDNLTRVFREALARHSDKIQEAPLLRSSTGD